MRAITARTADPAFIARGLPSVISCRDLRSSLVLQQRFGESADLLVNDFLRAFSVEVVAFDAAQLRMARDASRRFGRGRHRAALNYGDCFSYALAMTRGLPPLFLGEGFRKRTFAD